MKQQSLAWFGIVTSFLLIDCASPPAPTSSDASTKNQGWHRAATAPQAQPQHENESIALQRRSATPRYVRLGRIEGYGNPKTGELWVRPVGDTGTESAANSGKRRVVAQAQAISLPPGQTPGYKGFDAIVMNDTVADSNPMGTIEMYTAGTDTGDPDPSFDPTTCYGYLGAGSIATPVDFASQGVGCALQHIGNFTNLDFTHMYLDPDYYAAGEPNHWPWGPPYTAGSIATPSIDGVRDAPDAQRGLWDFGPVMHYDPTPGYTNHLVNMWIFFKNVDSLDFKWSGSLIGEVYELCGNNVDEDGDGVFDNGCRTFGTGSPCYANADCVSGACGDAVTPVSIVSRFGMAGGSLNQDSPSMCVPACGDSVKEGFESCDDGNTNNGDGCSDVCQIEPQFQGVVTWGDSNDDVPGNGGSTVDSAMDLEGNLYILTSFQDDITVAGTNFSTPGGYGGLLMKLSPRANLLWVLPIYSSTAGTDVIPERVVVDVFTGEPVVVGTGYGGGNVIVDGNDIGPQNSGTTGFAFKMDRFGGMLWGRTLPSTANNRVLALTQDSATGDFVMGGDFVDDLDAGIGCSPVTTASGDTAAFVLRVDPWGGFCDGIAMLGSDSSSETVVGLAPTGDSSADVIAIGSYSNATDIGGVSLAAGGGGNAFYARLQADGTASWANGLNGAEYQFLQDVRATPSGDFVIAGYYDSSITLPTDNGSVTLSGSTHGTILARGSAGTGNLFWATGQRGGGSASTGLRRIAVDREGDVRLAFSASATSQTRFGSAPVPTGYHALHVVMVDGNTGATRRYDVFDYTGTTFIVGSVTASPVGDLLIGGAFMGSGALGTLDFSSQGSFDQYIMGISVEPSWFDDVGCADGQREGFLDIANYRDIAGCSGGFSVPGVTTVSPATCGLHAGDDGNDPSGMGCNVSDLCANGWHVCSDDADVGISSPTGCFNSFGPYDFGFFFATRQKSSSNYMCDDTGSNDIFGCGDLSGQSPDTGTCTTMGLVAFNDSACLATSSWICDADSTMEAATVTHSDASEGGVLCCRD